MCLSMGVCVCLLIVFFFILSIDHFSRRHGMLIEKLINYDISTGVLWWLEYFLYHDQSLLKNYFCLCSCKYYEPLEGYS